MTSTYKTTDYNEWCLEVTAVHPNVTIHQERLSLNRGGFAKVAFVGHTVVGKFTFSGTEHAGWVAE